MKRDHVIITIILLALLTRLLFLGEGSIRADEGGTLALAKADWNTYLKDAHGDVHPPLYYRILHLFTIIGNSEFTIRLSSIIPSVLSVLILYLLGKKLFDEKTALLSSCLLAIGQFHIRYAQFLRMYSLLVLLSLLSTYFYWIIITEKPRLRTKIFYILASTALIYTHYYGFLILIFQGIFLIIDNKARKRIIPHLILFAIIILLFLPWAPIIKDQLFTKTELENTFTEEPLKLTLTGISSHNIFVQGGMFIYQYLIGYLKAALNVPFILITLTSISLIILAAHQLIRKRNRQILFLTISLFGSIGIILLIQYFRLITVMPYSRYLILVSPFLLLLISFGISTYKKTIGYGLAGLWIVLNLITLIGYYSTDYQRENWKTIPNHLSYDCSTSDCVGSQSTVYLYPASYAYNLGFYYQGTIMLIPTNEPVTEDMSIGEIYQRVKIPSNTPNFCAFTATTPDTFTIITVSDTTPLLEPCLRKYTKESTYQSTYKDIWGQTYTDITVTTYIT